MIPEAPLIDILLPFWGDPELLFATIDSVRNQSDPAWRLTIVDDCYPDASVAAHFEAEGDPRIIYLRNPRNLGICGNFERCLRLADAELTMFLGCDDLLHPDFVATVRRVHAASPDAAIIQPGVTVIDESGRSVLPLGDRVKRRIMPRLDGTTVLGGEELATSLLRGNWLYWPSLVFRTEAIQRHGFRQDLPIILDLAIILDLVAAGAGLVVEPTVCFSYRRHSASLSAATLLGGRRLADEQRFYNEMADRMRDLGWARAARAARVRWTSRLHALSLLPTAVQTRPSPLRSLFSHAFGR